MKFNKCRRLFATTHLPILVSLCLFVLSQNPALGQTTAGSDSASLRGTAKVNGNLVVEGVIVVVTGPKKGVGSPIPAPVMENTGEYRIEDIRPGNYKVVALGGAIQTKQEKVTIVSGNSNILDLVLKRATRRTKVRGLIFDNLNKVLPNQKVFIFSSLLPPSVCARCALGETVSNELGEIAFTEVASDEEYSFAIETGNKGELAMVASSPVEIPAGDNVCVKMKFGVGAEPSLTASLLPPSEAPSIWDPKPGPASQSAPVLANASSFADLKPGKEISLKFAPNNTELSPEAKQALDVLANEVMSGPKYFVAISLPQDSSLDSSTDEQRSGAILRYLVEWHGIPSDRIGIKPAEPISQISGATISKPTFKVTLFVPKQQ